MKRRSLLRATAGALGSGALAGCAALFGGEEDHREPATRDTTTRDGGRRTDDGDVYHPGEASDDLDSFAEQDPAAVAGEGSPLGEFRWNPAGDLAFRTTVGSAESRADRPFPRRSTSATVALWNHSLSRRTLRLTLGEEFALRGDRDQEADPTWERRVTFGPEDYAVVRLLGPGDHLLVVHRQGHELGTVHVDREDFCRDRPLRARVRSDGTVETWRPDGIPRARRYDTDPCPDPVVVATESAGEPARCQPTTDDARPLEFAGVEPVDGRVRVTGRVAVPDTCRELGAVTAEIRPERRALDVLVVTDETGGDCRQCPAFVPYEVTVDLRRSYPSGVDVRHRSDGRTRTIPVRTKSRP